MRFDPYYIRVYYNEKTKLKSFVELRTGLRVEFISEKNSGRDGMAELKKAFENDARVIPHLDKSF